MDSVQFAQADAQPLAARQTLGIAGGMGPAASAALLRRIVELTPAVSDQDHIEIFVHNNPHIPDRTDGIILGGPSPLPQLRRTIEILNSARVNLIALACITAHHFIAQLQPHSQARIIDGVDETVSYCRQRFSAATRIGVLASTGALSLDLFQSHLRARGLEPVILDAHEQRHLFTEPVYAPWGIKAGCIKGEPVDRIHEAVSRLQQLGSDAVIAGCSELPLVLNFSDTPIPVVDSMECLSRSAVRLALNPDGRP
ncbi:aspartate/glutamate racemase family protein [uncultured Serinicoccus sp.]|uniref:aspartate/glutamate racemase family protein n=1 Tax=uncultured Serinicoccus sp. TaxID=735514 RepID=UPI0026021A13|nr:amino acid racemase [uncultured Serinicoccus sp.]